MIVRPHRVFLWINSPRFYCICEVPMHLVAPFLPTVDYLTNNFPGLTQVHHLARVLPKCKEVSVHDLGIRRVLCVVCHR